MSPIAWSRKLLLAGLIAASTTLAPTLAHAQSSTGSTPPPPDVPAALQVPEDQVLLFRAFAVGTQNYECQAVDGATASWTFRQPRATLVGDDGQPLGIHGRGPFWAGYDGSSVVGSAPVSAPGADPAHDVPLLLLRATSAEASGRFANVNYVQRLNTHGGAAPAGACDPQQEPSLAVPYLAVYYFYGAPTVSSQSTAE
jgi:hypothetical protein